MNAKRDGGIVLLDINEAPSTLRDPKRRKTTNLTADDKKTNNPDALENVSPSIGSTPTTVSSAAGSSAINSTTPPALVLGHKSGVSETELPTASKGHLPLEDPYDITKELAQTEAGRSGMSSAGSGVTASKSTPDYAAGLVGSTNSPHPVNRYGAVHDSSGLPLKSSGISLLSNSGSNTSSEMFPKTSSVLSLPVSKDSGTSIAENGSNSFNSAQSSDISNPLSSGLSNQNFFKLTQNQQQLPLQQQSQSVQPLSQQQQTSDLYRNFANQYTASQQKIIQGQSIADQSTPTSPINNMYGVIRHQQPLIQPVMQQQQQQPQQQRLMYNPASSSIPPQQVQTRPAGQSVIHSNPQPQQQMQFEMSLQQQQQQQQQMQQLQQQQRQQQQPQQPRPFGMYGQINQANQNQGQLQPVQQAHADAPQVQPQPQRFFINREVTQQASAIFNASNCLTRPEKALILGFMAGTQANPAPQMGPICMIRYLEKVEERQTAAGNVTVVIEEHFQMNFDTSEWKMVRSVRQADSNYQVPSQDHSGNQTRIVVLDPNQQHHFVTVGTGLAQQPVAMGNAQNQQQQQMRMVN